MPQRDWATRLRMLLRFILTDSPSSKVERLSPNNFVLQLPVTHLSQRPRPPRCLG